MEATTRAATRAPIVREEREKKTESRVCHSLDAEGFLLTVTKRNASGRRLARYELERKYPRSGWIFRWTCRFEHKFRRGGRNLFRFRGSGGRTGEKYNDPRHGVLLILLPSERFLGETFSEERVA